MSPRILGCAVWIACSCSLAVAGDPPRGELGRDDAWVRAGDQLGVSVDVHGDWSVVGAPGADRVARECGAVLLFRRDGDSWHEHTAWSGRATRDEFGRAVSLDASTLAVGAPSARGSGSTTGAVSLFGFDGHRWGEHATLVWADARSGDRFGDSVALDGDVLFVGAPGHDGAGRDAGAVVWFERHGDRWSLGGVFVPNDLRAGDGFGRSVAVADGLAIIGAPWRDGAFVAEGAVARLRGAGTWTFDGWWSSAAPQPDALFGFAVAVDGIRVAAGAPRADGARPHAGAVEVWRRDTQRIERRVRGERVDGSFGFAVALDGEAVVVGAPNDDGGRAVRDDGVQRIVWRGSDGAKASRMGAAVAVGDGMVHIGQPLSSSRAVAGGARLTVRTHGLGLNVSVAEPAAGSPFTLRAAPALPRSRVLFAVVGIDGTPWFHPLSWNEVAGGGAAQSTWTTPSGLGGLHVELQAFGLGVDGVTEATSIGHVRLP